MKFLLCFALVVACAVAAPPYFKRGGYKPSGMYVYNYTAMMKVKVTGAEKQYTKLHMNATLELHFLPTKDEVLLKIQKFDIMEVLRDPARGFTKVYMASPLAEILRKYLILPIKFGYKDGLVNIVHAKREDPEWSLDMKKSVLNLLHLDIKGKDEETGSNALFTKPEVSVFGICNTTYQIADFAVLIGEERQKLGMNITKVIDSTNCSLQKTDAVDMITNGAETEKKPLQKSAMISYNIIGNELKFKIESLNATGLYILYPFSKNDGSVLAVTYQRLVLWKEGGSLIQSEQPEWLENLVPRGNLIVGVPPVEKPDFLLEWKDADWDRLVKFIHTSLKTFVDEYSPTMEPSQVLKNLTGNETEKVLMLVNSVKLCKKEILEKLWKKCDEKTRPWLIYLMTMCHTEECIEFMINKIKTTDLPRYLIEEYLISISFCGKPTKKIVNLVSSLCEISKIKNDPKLKTTCLVAVSNLVKSLCKVNKICSTEFVEKIIKMVKELKTCKIEKNECLFIEKVPATILLTIAENVMVIPKLMPEFFTILEKIIQREKLPTEIRVKAIWACRPIIKVMPKRVRILLVRIYTDPRINIEFRMAAFTVLMENPTVAIIQICARHLMIEPSLNVRRFVFDFITAVATTRKHLKYNQEIVRGCQIALKVLWKLNVPSRFGVYSTHMEIKEFFKLLKVGAHMTVNSIVTNSSFIPKYLQRKLNVTILGQNIELLDAEMRIEGLQEYLAKFFGPTGQLYDKKMIMDIIRNPRSLVGQGEDVDPLKTVPRPDEELKLFTHIKVYDKIFFINYTTLASNFDLKDLLLKGALFRAVELEKELKKGKVFSWFKPISTVDVVYKLPTLVGVPLTYNLTSLILPRVKAEIKAEVKPNIFSATSFLSNERESVDASIKLNVSSVAQVMGSVFFSLPVYEVGLHMKTVMNVSTELHAKANLDLKTWKYTFEIYSPLRYTREPIFMQQETYHYIKPYPIPGMKVPTNVTMVKVEPWQTGELMIINVTKPCESCRHEEWILKTKDGKYVSIRDNSLVVAAKPTIFQVFFYGRHRNLIRLYVPKIGYITMSRKSHCLVVDPKAEKTGKLFKIEYKNLTSVVLKTWAVLEKPFVPKEWSVLGKEIMKQQVREYERETQLLEPQMEYLIEEDELLPRHRHIRRTFLTVVRDQVCVSPKKEEAIVFEVIKKMTHEEYLRKLSLQNGLCIGTETKVCLKGFFSMSKPRPVLPIFISPGEIRMQIIPTKETVDKLIIKVEKENEEDETKVMTKYSVKFITAKKELQETRLNVIAKIYTLPRYKVRVNVIPATKTMFMFEKMCIEQSFLPDGLEFWLSMDKECKIKHMKMDLIPFLFHKTHYHRDVMTFRLNYTTEKMPMIWQSIINGTMKYIVRPILFRTSDKLVRKNNTMFHGVTKGSGLIKLHLTSNRTMKIKVVDAKRTFVYDEAKLNYYMPSFPRGTDEIPLMTKLLVSQYPFCHHQDTSFVTFDNKIYDYKLRGECEHVLIRNCSANMTRFLVLIRKIPNSLKRALRIIVADQEFDIIPNMDWKKKPEVLIDGVETDIESIYEKYDSMKRPVYIVTWEPKLKSLVFIDYRIGLTLRLMKGWKVTTQVSPWYFSKVCGLCGNFDGEVMHEFETPENKIVECPKLFGSSWILPGKECSDMCTKDRKHREIAKVAKSLYCKTSIPIPKCMPGCKPTIVEKTYVQALCSEDTEVQRTLLNDKLLYGKETLIKTLTGKMVEVEIPVECSCGCKNKRTWPEEVLDDEVF